MATKSASSAMADILGPSYKSKSTAEPPSGIQGAGTKSEPYDQGNQPEQTTSSNEPVSGVQGAGTKDEPFDQGNQEEQSEGARPTVNGDAPADEERGRSTKWPTRSNNPERSVSPGQLDDGTHVKTSGDNGEGYQPSGHTLGKLKNRLHIGGR